ncbi:MAG: hypothetical protein QF732_02910 [Nitrospinaceae bacterium]|nr:hypothetical protein [Nitrospinaceae bacterium]
MKQNAVTGRPENTPFLFRAGIFPSRKYAAVQHLFRARILPSTLEDTRALGLLNPVAEGVVASRGETAGPLRRSRTAWPPRRLWGL